MLTRLTTAAALPAIGLYGGYIAIEAGGRRRVMALWGLLAWSACIATGLALYGLYDLARFGHLTNIGYRAANQPFHAPVWPGLEGLLVSPGKGLVWYCPLVLLALVLWPTLLTRRRAEGLLALGIVLPTLVVLATLLVWWGSICWGPRYLLPVLPFVLLPLAILRERLPHLLWVQGIIFAVMMLSVLVQGLGVAVHPARYLTVLC